MYVYVCIYIHTYLREIGKASLIMRVSRSHFVSSSLPVFHDKPSVRCFAFVHACQKLVGKIMWKKKKDLKRKAEEQKNGKLASKSCVTRRSNLLPYNLGSSITERCGVAKNTTILSRQIFPLFTIPRCGLRFFFFLYHPSASRIRETRRYRKSKDSSKGKVRK